MLANFTGILPTFSAPGILITVDCIAVDRHIRGFAQFAGLEENSYNYLRDVFSFAADLLSISRREFDASIRQLSVGKILPTTFA